VQFWWKSRANWAVDEWHLPFAVFIDGIAVGVQELFAKQFPTIREVGTGSWLTQGIQGRGIGKRMRAAVLRFAFDELGALAAHSNAFADNHASNRVSCALGYTENGRNRQAPRGERREMINYVLTADSWRKTEWANFPIHIRGAQQCQDFFGLDSTAREV
jgi:RimJ/RimL family protein N-acetyltransferase